MKKLTLILMTWILIQGNLFWTHGTFEENRNNILVINNGAGEDFRHYNNVTRYDNYFSKYTKRNFGPAFNWHHFKAQAIAESGLKKNAKSYVGAIGLMQIMPATYEEIIKRHRYIKGSSNSPKWNIAAGISYNRSIWNLF